MNSLRAMLATLLAGCTRHTDHTSSRVWSDDDQASLEWRDFWGQGSLGDVMSGAPPAGTTGIVHERDGARVLFPRERRLEHRLTRNNLYFMRSRHYALVVLEESWQFALVLDANSGVELWRHGTAAHQDMFYLPSPDGAVVAAFRRVSGDEVAGMVIAVEFLDAFDGALLGEASLFQHSVTDHAGTFDGYMDLTWATWTPAGELVVETEAGVEAVAVSPDGTVTPTAVPGCWYPATTSSLWSSMGEALPRNDLPTDDLVQQPFGCQ